MTARREFLQFSFGASLAPLFAGVGPLLAAGDEMRASSVPQLTGLLYDLRVPQSLARARELERLCSGQPAESGSALLLPAEGVSGNVAGYWLRTLQSGWEQSGVLAGTTGEDVLFQLQQLAWQYRLRVLWQFEHQDAPLPSRGPEAGGRLLSWVIG